MAVEARQIALLIFLLPNLLVGQNLLDQEVSVDLKNTELSTALAIVARQGGLKLSYNARSVNGDSVVSITFTGTMEVALKQLAGPQFDLKQTGRHVILLKRSSKKQRYMVSGRVLDQGSGTGIPLTYVHGVSGKALVSTNEQGVFDLPMKTRYEPAAILVSRKSHRDTVIYVSSEQAEAPTIVMEKRTTIPYVEPLCVYDRCNINDLGVAKLLVSSEQRDMVQELGLEEERTWQVSFVPGVGTNGNMAGLSVNRYSFNILAGYSRGLRGIEIGGITNMESEDVKGLQIAGITNLVGGRTTGVQAAGIINHTMRSVDGVQMGGIANVAWDTIRGAQVSGAINVAKERVSGVQATGAVNVALKDVSGAQISGIANFSNGEVSFGQIASGSNYAHDIRGIQAASWFNFALDTMHGAQVSSLFNVAGKGRGFQFSLLNIAKHFNGVQLGLVNISDSIHGVPVGLLSISRKGYHRFDVITTETFPINAAIRTGTRNFHNILTMAYDPGTANVWGVGYGFGIEPRIDKHSSMDIQLTGTQISENNGRWVEALNVLLSFRLAYTFTIADRVALFLGPSANSMVSNWQDAEGNFLSNIAPGDANENVDEDVRSQGWLGFHAGFGVRF